MQIIRFIRLIVMVNNDQLQIDVQIFPSVFLYMFYTRGIILLCVLQRLIGGHVCWKGINSNYHKLDFSYIYIYIYI